MNSLSFVSTKIHPLQAVASGAVLSENSAKVASILPLAPASTSESTPSNFRRIFKSSDQLKTEFTKFLKTIFYQLDEKKVFKLMQKLLDDPNKSDEQIYNELLKNIHSTKKSVSGLRKIWSLWVLKAGMGKQVAELTQGFRKDKFQNYMEIYDRRYLNSIRKIAKLPFKGHTIAVCDNPKGPIGIGEKIQAGALLSKYPYKQQVELNDSDCKDPLNEPEKTCKPISDEVSDKSVDMISCLGGLHHIPAERVDAFVDSMNKKLRPGGVILLREHNIADKAGPGNLPKEQLRDIAAMVHTFVNAADGAPWTTESKEVREFKSAEEWTQLMQKHGFTRVSSKELVLKDDPTENAMMAFVRTPTTFDELKESISYRNDCKRENDGTYGTWIEWGNVRSSKQYAEYIQNHHSYAFDYIGQMRQHWQYFFNYLKACKKDPDVKFKDIVFSNNMAMNLFILTVATTQLPAGYATSLPSALVARWKHGPKWRDVCNLSELEKFNARNEKEYSSYIDHTPFYMYDYVGKMKEMWKTVAHSKEGFFTKAGSVFSAAAASVGFLASAAISKPVRSLYLSEGNKEPDTIKVLIADPKDELNKIIQQWEKDKDQQHEKDCKIEVIHRTADGYKLVSLPRYRPFTKICGYLTKTKRLQILEAGSQKKVSVDVLLKKGELPTKYKNANVVYEMDKLQDAEERRYVTYLVNVSALKEFQKLVGKKNIEYIHE